MNKPLKNDRKMKVESENIYKTLLETLPQRFFFKDKNLVYSACNKSYAGDFNKPPDEITGKTDYDLYPKELAEKHIAVDHQVLESGKTIELEEEYVEDGQTFWFKKIKAPIKDDDGKITGILGIFWDITDLKRINELLKNEISEGKRREEIISRQTQEILELSTPVLQIMDGVVVAPLIGTIDSERTQQFMERFLETIVKTNSPVALVDITGVPTLDTQTAQHLIEAVTAATLLGAKVIVTGVSPAIAQTLVHLGIDLPDIITKSSLSAGLKVALEFLDLTIAPKK